MKRPVLIFLGVAILVLAVGGGVWWKYFRGTGPAVPPPGEDIAKLIDQNQDAKPADQSADHGAKPATNNTGMPLKLPAVFSISIFSRGLDNPRDLIQDPRGRILVSIPAKGTVVALPDDNHDGTSDRTDTLLANLNHPHGLALQCSGDSCVLYVAETNAVAKYDYDAATEKITNRTKLADLPGGGEHTTRSLLLLDDKTLLVSIGSSCNVCNESDSRRASIMKLDLSTNQSSPYATGLRNSVFLTKRPDTNEVWATDMGRDYLGDNTPPDEVNIIQDGKNYGWPICYAQNVHDTNFDKNKYIQDPCTGKVPPRIEIPAHSAPLGLAFLNTNNLLVAFHGSWNRSVPTGYKVVHYTLNDDGSVKSTEDFLSGWLKGGAALGRPVDILVTADGSLLISDDKAGLVYRLSHS